LTGREDAANHSDLWGDFGDVDIWQNDGWIIAAHLKGDSLHGLCGRCHDTLAGDCGAGKADLVNVWVVD